MKKNKVFVNENKKHFNNNQSCCDVKNDKKNILDEKPKKIVKNEPKNVEEKLKKLFERNGYVFNVDVNIVTLEKTYKTRIAGLVNNHLITLDNDIIDINDIKDIVISE